MNNDFRYTGVICPVCNESFKAEDDIVVCPLCGTPHHRDCYKKNGECAHNEKHNEGYRWTHIPTPPPALENTVNPVPPFMNTDGAETHNSRDAASTVFWGTQQNPFDAYPKELDEGVTTEEAAEFVQMNAHKYIQNFFYLKSGKKTFNWAAFLFAPYWFFYRKMTKIGIIFMAILLGLSIVSSIPQDTTEFLNGMYEISEKYQSEETMSSFENSADYTKSYINELTDHFKAHTFGGVIYLSFSIISGIIHLVIGFMANKWYYNHTVSKIRKIKTEATEPEIRKLRYYKEGGMSMGAAFLAILANNMVVMAFDILFTMIK